MCGRSHSSTIIFDSLLTKPKKRLPSCGMKGTTGECLVWGNTNWQKQIMSWLRQVSRLFHKIQLSTTYLYFSYFFYPFYSSETNRHRQAAGRSNPRRGKNLHHKCICDVFTVTIKLSHLFFFCSSECWRNRHATGQSIHQKGKHLFWSDVHRARTHYCLIMLHDFRSG